MLSVDDLILFFLWGSVINFAILAIAAVSLIVLKSKIATLHQTLFDIDVNQLKLIYFKFLALYKILILVFFFVPYCSLTLMS